MLATAADTTALSHYRDHSTALCIWRNAQDERLPLHLVCALVPNFLFLDVIHAMVASFSDSAGCMDKVLTVHETLASHALDHMLSACLCFLAHRLTIVLCASCCCGYDCYCYECSWDRRHCTS